MRRLETFDGLLQFLQELVKMFGMLLFARRFPRRILDQAGNFLRVVGVRSGNSRDAGLDLRKRIQQLSLFRSWNVICRLNRGFYFVDLFVAHFLILLPLVLEREPSWIQMREWFL